LHHCHRRRYRPGLRLDEYSGWIDRYRSQRREPKGTTISPVWLDQV
jgi:hypothetical protein